MKRILVIVFVFCSINTYSQSSINSGAISSEQLIYTVGEIFVIPNDTDDASSGTIGSVSRIEFLITGIDEILSSNNVNIYPNPTRNTIYIETDEINIETISIYDTNGRLITKRFVNNNQVDLTNLQTGIYIIKINNTNTTFKIVKN